MTDISASPVFDGSATPIRLPQHHPAHVAFAPDAQVSGHGLLMPISSMRTPGWDPRMPAIRSAGPGREDHRQAAASAPEYVESAADYPTLLEETEWDILDRRDFTIAFARSCATRLRLEQGERDVLLPLAGAAELDRRQTLMRRRIAALKRGTLKRELFLAAPAGTKT